jgi:exodeoxyribonuclease V alpha subunit
MTSDSREKYESSSAPYQGPSAASARLLAAGDISLLDALTVRDLRELSGMRGDAPLEKVLLLLFAAFQRGSPCLPLAAPELRKQCGGILAENEFAVFMDKLRDGDYAGLIGNDPNAASPLIFQPDAEGAPYLYLQKYLLAELSLKENLSRLLDDSPLPHDPGAACRARAAELFQLNAGQRDALELAAARRLCLIAGGPGTGKTYLLSAVLSSFLSAGLAPENIFLAAPTGRAAQRMESSVRESLSNLPEGDSLLFERINISTLHRLLGFSPARNAFRFNRRNPLSASLVVIDETSMVDIALMAALADALPEGARLILIGDPRQLPPVGAGAVLSNLFPPHAWGGERIAVLTESRRMQGEVGAFAESLRASEDFTDLAQIAPPAELAECLHEAGQGETYCRVVEPGADASTWRRRIAAWMDGMLFGEKDSFACALASLDVGGADFAARMRLVFRQLATAQVLTVLRNGRYGCDSLNDFLAGIFREKTDPGSRGKYFHGLPLVIERNSYPLELFNGDTGIILKNTRHEYFACFPDADNFRVLPLESLPAFSPAYALTVHKSQGCEFDHVLLALPPGDSHASPILQKQTVYTAVTRARRGLVLYGSYPLLQQALSTEPTRYSAISLL